MSKYKLEDIADANSNSHATPVQQQQQPQQPIPSLANMFNFFATATPAVAAAKDSPRTAAENYYSKTFVTTRRKAKAGDKDAMFELGMIYRSGRGRDQMLSKSEKWLTRAGDHGSGEAFNFLGELHYLEAFLFSNKPSGASQKLLTALEFYTIASEEYDYAPAMLNRACMYLFGPFVENSGRSTFIKQDHHKAKLWLEKAAQLGHVPAKQKLEWLEKLCTFEGLVKLAEDSNDVLAQLALGIMYECGRMDTRILLQGGSPWTNNIYYEVAENKRSDANRALVKLPSPVIVRLPDDQAIDNVKAFHYYHLAALNRTPTLSLTGKKSKLAATSLQQLVDNPIAMDLLLFHQLGEHKRTSLASGIWDPAILAVSRALMHCVRLGELLLSQGVDIPPGPAADPFDSKPSVTTSNSSSNGDGNSSSRRSDVVTASSDSSVSNFTYLSTLPLREKITVFRALAAAVYENEDGLFQRRLFKYAARRGHAYCIHHVALESVLLHWVDPVPHITKGYFRKIAQNLFGVAYDKGYNPGDWRKLIDRDPAIVVTGCEVTLRVALLLACFTYLASFHDDFRVGKEARRHYHEELAELAAKGSSSNNNNSRSQAESEFNATRAELLEKNLSSLERIQKECEHVLRQQQEQAEGDGEATTSSSSGKDTTRLKKLTGTGTTATAGGGGLSSMPTNANKIVMVDKATDQLASSVIMAKSQCTWEYVKVISSLAVATSPLLDM